MSRVRQAWLRNRAKHQFAGRNNASTCVAELMALLAPGDTIDQRVYVCKFLVARLLAPSSVIEIGVRAGYSAWCFCQAVPGMAYLGIDNDSNTHGGRTGLIDHARQLLKGFNVSFVVADSQQLAALPTKADLVHVDGDHSYKGTMHDLELSAGATDLILVDDYWFLDEVRRATDDFAKQGWMLLEIDHKQALLVRA